MTRVLVVDDNSAHIDAARVALGARAISRYTLAHDYAKGSAELATGDYSHLLTDLFIPEEAGSGKKDLGYAKIELLEKADPEEVKKRGFLEKMRPHVDEDPELDILLGRYFGSLRYSDDPLQQPVVLALMQVSKTVGSLTTSIIAKNTLGMTFTDDRRDYFY